MEFVGPNMAKFLLLRQSGSIPEPRLPGVMWQLLTAAEGMHARDIIHHDINPTNVLVLDDLCAVSSSAT
jgi:serine/threonine protein kinase